MGLVWDNLSVLVEEEGRVAVDGRGGCWGRVCWGLRCASTRVFGGILNIKSYRASVSSVPTKGGRGDGVAGGSGAGQWG